MNDQAEKLRRLVLQHAGHGGPTSPAPPVIAFTGAKPGVGTTTVALNLGLALAQRHRVIIIDADFQRGDVALLCRLRPRHDLSDVLAGRVNLRQVLLPGPCGAQIAPGCWKAADLPGEPHERLLEQFALLSSLADFVVVDTGSEVTRGVLAMWLASRLVIAVSTIDAVSILETYAMVKNVMGLAEPHLRPVLATLINQSTGDSAAREAHERIANSCRRFLDLTVGSAGHIPWDATVPQAAGTGRPFVLSGPDSGAGQALRWIAASLAAISQPTRQPALGVDA
jgi:flagellar biosynthesis protein FlhG